MKRSLFAAILLAALSARADVTGGNAQDGVRTGLAGRMANKIAARYGYAFGATADRTLQLNDLAKAIEDALSLDKVSLSSQVTPGSLVCGASQYLTISGGNLACTTVQSGVFADAPLTGDGTSGTHLGCSTASGSQSGCLSSSEIGRAHV